MEGGSVRVWDWVTSIAGLALAVGLFLPWYRSNLENWTGWATLAWIDKVLLLTAIVALLLPLVVALKATDKQVQGLLLVIGALAIVSIAFTIYRMATPPEFDTVDEPVFLRVGVYLALAGSVVILVATALGARARLARRAAA